MEEKKKRNPAPKAADDEGMEKVFGGTGADPSQGCPHCGSFQIVRVSGGFKCLDCGHQF